jgi:hypothetical protein
MSSLLSPVDSSALSGVPLLTVDADRAHPYKLFQNPLVDVTTPAIPALKSPPTGF